MKCQKPPFAISLLQLGVRRRFLSMLKNHKPGSLARWFLTKWLFFILGLVLLVVLAGCKNTNNPPYIDTSCTQDTDCQVVYGDFCNDFTIAVHTSFAAAWNESLLQQQPPENGCDEPATLLWIYQARCQNNTCVAQKSVCGNSICEAGEADRCPACYNNEPACLAPCNAGTCPQDCEEIVYV